MCVEEAEAFVMTENKNL